MKKKDLHLPTRSAVHGLFQDLQLVIELCKQRALAQRPRDEAALQLVGDVVASRDLLLGVGGLRQQLAKDRKKKKNSGGVTNPRDGTWNISDKNKNQKTTDHTIGSQEEICHEEMVKGGTTHH